MSPTQIILNLLAVKEVGENFPLFSQNKTKEKIYLLDNL